MFGRREESIFLAKNLAWIVTYQILRKTVGTVFLELNLNFRSQEKDDIPKPS
jgi:hypothetical protein